jgi:hypothetical protein
VTSMNRRHIMYHVVRADFLERVRRYSFLVTLAAALYLAYAAATGHIHMDVGDRTGIANSAWIGALMALTTNLFLSLAGFYIVKNAIQRDRQTRVGEILAATPLTRPMYTLGKALSNFLVLATMALLVALASVPTLLFLGAERRLDLWDLFGPSIVFSLPAMALVAALALLFETLPLLRGGFGNVAYFFCWGAALSLGFQTGPGFGDWSGASTVSHSMIAAVRAQYPAAPDSFSMTLNDRGAGELGRFRWEGLNWNTALLQRQLFWLAVAVGIALLAALFFDRFDPARHWRSARQNKPAPVPELADANGDMRATVYAAPAPAIHLTPLDGRSARFRFPVIVAAELRLMLKGRTWWCAVALGLLVAGSVSPLAIARQYLLSAAWIWPVLLWSEMGTREVRDQTEQIVFSSAYSVRRQLPALWCAGFVLALVTGAGVGVRFLLAGALPDAATWLVGALFIPTMALALGVWSKTSKTFEILYTLLWYVGPLSFWGLDFMGTSHHAATAGVWRYFLLCALALAVLAIPGRQRQLQA